MIDHLVKELTEIKGWGVDADPENDPTYPIKHRTDEEHKGFSWERPKQQEKTVEILQSVERPTITAVFGTSVPPRGLSGVIRRFAFKYSEGSFAHWIPLMVADRVDVVEGIIDDLKKGRIPNLFAEKGGRAVWKYNRKKIMLNALGGIIITSGIFAILLGRNLNLGSLDLEDTLPG